MLHPKTEVREGQAPARATAVDGTHALFRAPVTGKVTSASFVADAALNGADTNTRKIAIVNKGQAGAGATEIAALQFNNGINAVAFDEKPLTLSATAADLNVVEGDMLAVVSTHIGTGLADPGGIIEVKFARLPTA